MTDTKPQRFYQMMRLGATLKPQAFFALLNSRAQTCAYGAALDAVGLLANEYIIEYRVTPETHAYRLSSSANDIKFRIFPAMLCCNMAIACPNCSYKPSTLAYMTIHLNDLHRWTRNQIADFLEPIEEAWWAKQEQPQFETKPERTEQLTCS